jgi:hypothetical protein
VRGDGGQGWSAGSPDRVDAAHRSAQRDEQRCCVAGTCWERRGKGRRRRAEEEEERKGREEWETHGDDDAKESEEEKWREDEDDVVLSLWMDIVGRGRWDRGGVMSRHAASSLWRVG